MKRALLASLTTAGLLAAAARPAAAQPADAHAAATAIVAEVEQAAGPGTAPAAAKDGPKDTRPDRRAVTADALRDARAALERATRLRVAGDEAHAKAADGLALEWAETARDLARAADAEAAAADLRRKAIEAQAQLERSRAMVEEALASIGRLQAQLEQTASPGGKAATPRTAVEVHDGEPPPGKRKKGDKSGEKGAAGKDAPKKEPTKDAGGTP